MTTEKQSNPFKVYMNAEMERYKSIKQKAKVVATKRKRSVRDKIETLLEKRQLAKEGGYYGYDD